MDAEFLPRNRGAGSVSQEDMLLQTAEVQFCHKKRLFLRPKINFVGLAR